MGIPLAVRNAVAWVDSAIVAITDNPANIVRWQNSTGDHSGTAVDTPNLAPANLTARRAAVRVVYVAQLNVG